MQRPTLPVMSGFLLLMITFVYLAQASFIVQLVGVVDRVEGTAEVHRQGKGRWFHLKEESFVRTGDVLRTAENSRAVIRWLDGTRIRIAPNTRLKITKSTMNRFSKAKEAEFKLDIGKIWVRIIQALTPESKFEIGTPTSVAAVRGTIFSVEVKPDWSTEISVYEGKVALNTGNQEMAVSKGLNARVALPGTPPQPENQTPEDEEQWREQSGIISPGLNVRQPEEGAIVTRPRVTFAGIAEPSATLTINEVPVNLTGPKKDRFEWTVSLKPGLNIIKIVATDVRGTTTEVMRRVILQEAGTARVPPTTSGMSQPSTPATETPSNTTEPVAPAEPETPGTSQPPQQQEKTDSEQPATSGQ